MMIQCTFMFEEVLEIYSCFRPSCHCHWCRYHDFPQLTLRSFSIRTTSSLERRWALWVVTFGRLISGQTPWFCWTSWGRSNILKHTMFPSMFSYWWFKCVCSIFSIATAVQIYHALETELSIGNLAAWDCQKAWDWVSLILPVGQSCID